MLPKLFRSLLLLVIAIGVAMTIRAQLRVRPLRADYARLVAQYKELEIVDPTRFKIVRIADSEPRHYRWRLYRPDNVKLLTEVTNGFDDDQAPFTMLSGRDPAGEVLINLRASLDGPEVHFLLSGSLFCNLNISNPEQVRLLQTHWDELKIDLAASSRAYEFGEDEVLMLVEITAPTQFADGTRLQTADNGLCLRVRLGTEEAFALQKTKGRP